MPQLPILLRDTMVATTAAPALRTAISSRSTRPGPDGHPQNDNPVARQVIAVDAVHQGFAGDPDAQLLFRLAH